MTAVAPFPPELDNLLLEALQGSWRGCNRDYFHGALLPPVLALDDARTRLGQWRRDQRTLTLSRPLVRTHSWRAVREILKHEMAHQYVDEIMGVHDESAHGRCFLHVCSQRNIDARATGLPDGERSAGDALDRDDDRVMRRVQKLLALAGSSNANEAEAAANAAQRMMLAHNIAARARGPRVYATRALTAPALRLHAYEKLLAGLLTRHYFVSVVLAAAYLPDAGRHGKFVEASGTRDNLAMAEWIYGFLFNAAERAAQHAWQQSDIVGRDRLRFLAGFMSGVGDKLTREASKNVAAGLVWIGDPDLQDYVASQYPRLSSTTLRTHVNDAHARGRAAGNDVVISRPVSAPVAARGRLLE